MLVASHPHLHTSSDDDPNDAGSASCGATSHEAQQMKSYRAGHSRICKQLSCSIGSVLDEYDQRVIMRALRMSCSCDDADGTKVMKYRMVAANPVIQTHSCVAAVLRDMGHSVDDAVEAVMEGIRQSAVQRRGPLSQSLESEHTIVRPEIVKHVQ